MSIGTFTVLLEAALTPVLLVLVLAPGIGPAVALARRLGADRAWAAALAFGFSVAWAAVVGTVASYTGLGLTFVVWAYGLAALASAGWAVVQRRRGAALPAGGATGLLLALAAALVAWVQRPWWFGTPDTFYHLAAARSLLATGRPLVTDPFFGTASTAIDPTAGILQTLLAVLSRLTAGADVAVLFRGLTAVSAAAAVLAFWLFARRLAGPGRAATVATLAWVVGAWFTDFRDFGYPNKVSISLALIAIALLAWTVAERRREITLAAAVVGLAAFAMHIAAAELVLLAGVAIVVAALVAAWACSGGDRRRLLGGAGHAAAAVALTVVAAVPTLLPRLSALRGSSVMGSESFIWAADQVRDLPLGMRVVVAGGFDFGGGWAFALAVTLGLLALVRLRRPGSAETAVAAAVALLAPVLTLFPPVSTVALGFSSYMVARMVELLRFAPYAAAAWGLGLGERTERRGVLVTTYALLAATLVSGIPYLQSTYVQGAGEYRRGHVFSIHESQRRDLRPVLGLFDLKRLSAEVGDAYPVVMADAEAGYYLMGLAPVAVTASLGSHTPVFVGKDGYERRLADTQEFFARGTPAARRADLVEEYGARYVFVYREQTDAPEVLAELRADPAYEVAVEGPGFTLLRVR